VKAAYTSVVYHRQRLQVMREHNHYFEALIDAAEIHLDGDSITELTKVAAGTRYATFQSRMYIAEEESKRAEIQLRTLLYLPDGTIETGTAELDLYQIHPDKPLNERFDPVEHAARDAAQIAEAQSTVKLEKTKRYPAVHVGYINRHIEGAHRHQGWMAGLSVPLWMRPQQARIRQAEIDANIKASETEYRQFADRQHIETLQSLLNEYFVQISFSKENLLVEAQLVLNGIEKDFAEGHIADYADAFAKVADAVSVKIDHLKYISMYNQTALELEYYTQ
jgi:cobalt-zinc-cadmium resistance protein CzcA